MGLNGHLVGFNGDLMVILWDLMGLMVFNGDGMGLNGHLVGFNEISWDLMRFKNGDLMRFNGKSWDI
jgi:hypothetical protein